MPGPSVLVALGLGANTVSADPARIDDLGHGLVEGLVAIGIGIVEHEQRGGMEATDTEGEVLGGGLRGRFGPSEGGEGGLGQQESDLHDDGFFCVILCSLV